MGPKELYSIGVAIIETPGSRKDAAPSSAATKLSPFKPTSPKRHFPRTPSRMKSAWDVSKEMERRAFLVLLDSIRGVVDRKFNCSDLIRGVVDRKLKALRPGNRGYE